MLHAFLFVDRLSALGYNIYLEIIMEVITVTKIDIFSGFLGAGKTTLIRKLIAEAYKGEKLVLIENEFGDIAIDGGFLQDAGVEITEMNSGCICCTLVGDFTQALKKVMADYSPDRIIIEPSGVGKLSDVAKAVEHVEGAHIGSKLTVVDAGKCKMYMRNFGEFFNDQVSNADLIVMSRTDTVPAAKTMLATELLRHLNPSAGLISTPWDRLDGKQILEAMEQGGIKRQLEEWSMSITITTITTGTTRTAPVAAMTTTTSTNTTMSTNITGMSIITMNTMKTAPAAAMTIIMQMRSFQAGVWKHLQSLPRLSFAPSWRLWPRKSAAAPY